MDESILLVWLAVMVVFGPLAAWIASQKGRSVLEGLTLGALFGPLGVVVELCMPTLGTRDQGGKIVAAPRVLKLSTAQRAQAERDRARAVRQGERFPD